MWLVWIVRIVNAIYLCKWTVELNKFIFVRGDLAMYLFLQPPAGSLASSREVVSI